LVRICSVDGCEKKHKGKGFCINHYNQWYKYGDPLKRADPEETRKKISVSWFKKGHISQNKGKKLSAETRKKISEAAKRENLSDETIRKMSEARKGKIPWNKGRTGVYSETTLKKMSETGKNISAETRRKMSESSKRENLSAETRRKLSESAKNMSEETRKKISETLTGRTQSDATRKKKSETHSKPELKQYHRELLRKTRHNQTSPNIPESKIMKILTIAGIEYQFNPHVEYLTSKNEHRKKEVDFLIKPKKIIEFNGTYVHADPRKYKPDDKIWNKTAKNVWENEKIVLENIQKQGYQVLVIWEMDLNNDPKNTAKKILNFAKS
jgi:G:T-mismatch repair DNA endonuclease (very short patch repair protein)